MKTNINAETTISATIIRADGTKEVLGTISQKQMTISKKLWEKLKGKTNGNSAYDGG